MNSSAAIKSLPQQVYVFVVVIALSFILAIMPMSAHAQVVASPVSAGTATLTPTQISSILALLGSFGASQTTIQQVSSVLGGGGTPTTALSAMCTGTPYSPTNGSFGMNWGVTVSGGSGSYTYQWTVPGISWINPSLGGLNSYSTMVQYSSAGTKEGIVAVNDGRETITATCSATAGTSVSTPTASINQSSLTTASANPTITGMAANTQVIKMSLALTSGSPSPALGATVPVVNGVWSYQIAPPALSQPSLQNGVYTLYVYDANNNLLTTGTLTVAASAFQSLSATPTSGVAPLVVTFTGSVAGTNYTMNFGDGSNPIGGQMSCDPLVMGNTSSGCSSIPVNQTHTYTSPGTYTATLSGSGVAQTKTITVTAPSSTSGNPTGTLTANVCTVPAGATTCSVITYWSTQNPLLYEGSPYAEVIVTNNATSQPYTGSWTAGVSYDYLPGANGVYAFNLPAGSYSISLVTTSDAVHFTTLVTKEVTITPGSSPSSGGLSVSNSSSLASQTVIAGTNDFTFDAIQLDASQLSQNVHLAYLPLDLTITNGASLSDLSSCQLYNGSTALDTGSNVVNPSVVTKASNGNETNFFFDNALTVPAGTVLTLNLKCNLSSAAVGGAVYVWGIDTNAHDYTVNAVTSGASINVTGAQGGALSSAGAPTMTASGGGSMTLSISPASPSYSILAGGNTGVTLGVFNIEASKEGINLTKLGVTLTSGHPSDLSNLYFYNSTGTLLGTAQFVGSATTAVSTLTTHILLPINTQEEIVVKGDIANIGTNQPGYEGDLIKVNPLSAQGTGVSSGVTINAGNSGSSVAGVTMYKTYPIISLVSNSYGVPTSGVSDGTLMEFQVMANNAGSLGINQLTFKITSSSGVTVAAPVLYAYTDPAFSQAAFNTKGAGVVATTVYNASTGIAVATVVPGSPLEVPAGGSLYFLLKSPVVSSTGTNLYEVSTTLEGDSAELSSPSISTATTLDSSSNFVWSPNATQTVTSNSTDDWTNGVGVTGLSSTGLTQNRTGSPAPAPSPVPVVSWAGPQQFNGSGSGSSLGSPVTLGGAFTLIAWVDPSALAQQSYGFGVGGTVIDAIQGGYNNGGTAYATSTGYALGISSSGLLWWWPYNGGDVYSASAIPLNKWTQVALTYNGTMASMYINGVLSGTKTVGEPGAPLVTSVGGKSWITGAFSGSIANVSIYNSTLSATQISSLSLPPQVQAPSSGGTSGGTAMANPPGSELVATVVEEMQAPFTMLTTTLGSIFFTLGIY